MIAKRIDLPYQAGNRDGMQKIKNFRSADCVIGGFRYATNKLGGKKVVGSLLLGLYDDEGCCIMSASLRRSRRRTSRR